MRTESNEIQKVETNQIQNIDKNDISNVNVEGLLKIAIEKAISVETMEKLLAMRRELKEEWMREKYYQSLSLFQKNCPNILKSKKVDFISKNTGGRTKYNYAPLDVIVEQVKDLLQENGFSYTIKTKQDKETVTAICEAHHISGHSELTEFTIPIDFTAYMNDSQKVASALTYAKRYAFCNVFGIMTSDDDDDANITGKVEEEKPYQFTDIVKFGKYAGKKWLEVPIDYIQWLIKNGKNKELYDDLLKNSGTKILNMDNEKIDISSTALKFILDNEKGIYIGNLMKELKMTSKDYIELTKSVIKKAQIETEEDYEKIKNELNRRIDNLDIAKSLMETEGFPAEMTTKA